MDSPGPGQADLAEPAAVLSRRPHHRRYLCCENSLTHRDVSWQKQHQYQEDSSSQARVGSLNQKLRERWQQQEQACWRDADSTKVSLKGGGSSISNVSMSDGSTREDECELEMGNKDNNNNSGHDINNNSSININNNNYNSSSSSSNNNSNNNNNIAAMAWTGRVGAGPIANPQAAKTGRCCGNARRPGLVGSNELAGAELGSARQRGGEMAPTAFAPRRRPAAIVASTKANAATLLCKQSCTASQVVNGCSSQQQLDSCGSSDSGQGSNSLVTTASSLASVRITNSSSCGSSVSSCCSSSSSAASRWSSSSLGALERRSHSCGASSVSQKSQLANRCSTTGLGQSSLQENRLAKELAKSPVQMSGASDVGAVRSAERRRLSWLVSLGATGVGVQAVALKSDAKEPPRGVSKGETDRTGAASHYRLVHSSSASVSVGALSRLERSPLDSACQTRPNSESHESSELGPTSTSNSRPGQRLVVGGKIERVEFFPGDQTGGKLIVFLDVDGLQRAQLMDSELVRVVSESPQIKTAKKTNKACNSFEAANLATLIIEPPEETTSTPPYDQCSSSSSSPSSTEPTKDKLAVISNSSSSSTDDSDSTSSSSNTNLASLANLINSDASSSDFDDDDDDHDDDYNQDELAGRKDRAQFWRLVASETSSSPSSLASSPQPASSLACPLVKLIQAADEDPVNRPRLLFLNGRSDNFALPAAVGSCDSSQLGDVRDRDGDGGTNDDDYDNDASYRDTASSNRRAYQPPTTPSSGSTGRNQGRLNSIDEEQNNAPGCLAGSRSDISANVDLDDQDGRESSTTGSESDIDFLDDGNRDSRKHHLNVSLCDSSGSQNQQDDDDYFYDDEVLDVARRKSSDRVRPLPIATHYLQSSLASVKRSPSTCADSTASGQQQQQLDNNNCNIIDNNEQANAAGEQRQPETPSARLVDCANSGGSGRPVSSSLAAVIQPVQQQPSTSNTTCPSWTRASQVSPDGPASGACPALGLSATNLLDRIQAEHTLGARPLIVWAPSARRVSCPVGQLASFSSWRQLWPPERDLQSVLSSATSQLQPNANPSQIEQLAPACPNCLAYYQRNTQHTAGFRPPALGQQQQTNLGRSGRPLSPASECLSNSRKTSRPSLTCSDYFSSFDQSNSVTDQTTSCQNASLLSLSSQFSGNQQPSNYNQQHQQDLSSLRDVIAMASRTSGWRAGNHLQPSYRRTRCLFGSASNQGQRVGLPTAGELRRQSTITGFDHQKYQAPRSPSLCLPGVRRPPSVSGGVGCGRGQGATSPNNFLSANLQHQRNQLLASPTHSTGGSSSPSPTNWVAGNSGLSAANQVSHSQANNQRWSNQRSGAMRNRLESLESDRGSSPSWTASTSSLRSSIGGGSSCAGPGCPVPKLARFGPGGHNQLVGNVPTKQTNRLATIGKLDGLQSNSNNNNNNSQHVYFFLCCCQRRRSPTIEPAARGVDESTEGLETARRPLVGREPTVGSSPIQPQQQQQQRMQQQEAELTRAVDAAAGSNAPRGTPSPDNGVDGSGLANTCTASQPSQTETDERQQAADAGLAANEHTDRDQIGVELAKLIETLDKLKAASRDQSEPVGAPESLGHAQLIGRIRARLNDCEQLILGAAVQSGTQAASELAAAAGASSASRANLMRYSTPNLLLSSNFEHILRERGDKSNQQQQAGPPEALEAWFLSRTLAGGSSPTSGGAPRRTLQCFGSRESIQRDQQRPSGQSRISGATASEGRAPPQDERRDDKAQPGDGGRKQPVEGAKRSQQQAASVCQSRSQAANLATAAEKHPRTSNSITPSGELVGPTGGALPAPPSLVQDNKSMQQARYLYSTLTCNASALLASSHSTLSSSQRAPSPSSTAPASQASTSAGPQSERTPKVGVSPPRATHVVPRKQAQFVDRQQRKARVEREQKRLRELELATASPVSAQVKIAAKLCPSQLQAAPNEPHHSSSSSSSSSDSSDSSNSDYDSDSHSPTLDAAAWKRKPEATSSQPEPTRDENSLSADEFEAAQTPAIVESHYEHLGGFRRQSHGSQTSRSSSVNVELTGVGPKQQLQPTAMDPAMHALWAQGADLDTGNGNFIMATRRRRSVHVVHQVQLAQIQQQQQQHQQQQQQQQAQPQQLQGSKCFKIDERASTISGESTRATPGDAQTTSGARSLRNELRKLRATCSIDEVPVATGKLPDSGPVSKSTQAQSSASAKSARGASNAELSESWAPSAPVPVVTCEQPEVLELEAPCSPTIDLLKREQKQIGAQIVTGAHGVDEDRNGQTSDYNEDNKRFYQLHDTNYDLDDLESSSTLLANLYDWNYPIFELAEQYGHSILSKLSYRIFFDSGFFDSFKIPKQAFFNFFHALEEGYHHKPYHNRLHAADVLHAVYYLTSQPIDNFCQVPLDLIEHYDNLLATTRRPRLAAEVASNDSFNLHNHIVAVVVAAAAAAADSELPFGIMGANLTALEVMALYTAAAMHDFQHPGRTNSFLVATNSPLALLYNDRSVLENHHSAAAWALFYSGPNYNWLCNLEKDEFKRFRFMIIELILATDLMRHYELVSAFNKKLNNAGRHNIDWFCESDRLLVMEIIIKLADVNGPMKGHQLHCQWTDRIAMEFYEQGDEERALNLPVSLYMDRSDPRLPELQKSFINHLVGPLSHSYAAAGFFPKSTEPFGLSQAGNKSQQTNNNGQPNKELTTTNNNDNELDDNNEHYESLRAAKDAQPGRPDQMAGCSARLCSGAPETGARESELNSGLELDACQVEVEPKAEFDRPLPGAKEGQESEQQGEQLEVESVYSQSKYWLIDHSETSKLNKQFLRCTQTSNLRNNFLYWDAKSREKQTSTSANQSLDINDGDQTSSTGLDKEAKQEQ